MQNQDVILDRMTQNIVADEKLLQHLGVDFRWLRVRPADERPSIDISPDSYADEWGVVWRFLEHNYNLAGSPLSDATIEDLDTCDWPDPSDPGRTRGLAEQARHLYENTDYVIAADAIKGGLFTTALWLRGYEQVFMDLAVSPEFAEALLDRVLDVYKALWSEYLNAVGPYVQLVYWTDDFGAQDNMMVSAKMFRQYFKHRLKEIIDHIKGMTDAKLMLHSDGAIAPIIGDLVEIGVDILNPIQTSAMGMDTKVLKEKFGGQVCFHGAIDVQKMLPLATPEEVRRDVVKRIHDLGRGGGYILAPSHNLGHDIPPENILSMFQAAQDYGQYPLELEPVLSGQ
jgi:uroporphyrinogen decarboxylase